MTAAVTWCSVQNAWGCNFRSSARFKHKVLFHVAGRTGYITEEILIATYLIQSRTLQSPNPQKPTFLTSTVIRLRVRNGNFRYFSEWRVGRDSAVGIATRHGLDRSGIESRWGFSAPVHTGPGAHPAPYTMGIGSLSRGWRWPPIPSSDEVKERVQLYRYSPYGPLWPVLM